MIQTCAGCGSQLPDEARYCLACGRAVQGGSGEERRIVTILFADVADSTGLGERLDPERLREVMQAYFNAMRKEIEAEGGTVEKFIGDAVMAVFGVPVAHEDDPARALRAALRMRGRLATLNEELEGRHSVRLAVRVGINTGEVVSGSGAGPREAMVSGDAVNVAARLEQVAEPGQVLVGERTARAARGFQLRAVGPLSLRGKDAGVSAHELLEAAPARRRGVPGLRAPMLGRDAEVDLLRSLYTRVAGERRPHLVTVYGDPGVGKSRLVAEFIAWLERLDAPPRTVRGRCLPYGLGVTYWPLGEILKRGAGVAESDTPEVARARVREHCAGLLSAAVTGDPERATVALAVTIGLEDVITAFGDLEPRQVRSHMHAGWRSYFSALAADRPLVVVVEDIHWAEDPLLDLLEEVADRVPHPVLFVCPSRPELTQRRPSWGGGRRSWSSLVLEPLSSEDSVHLIDALLSVAELPGELRERIVARADGNPFFLEEILRRLIDEGRLRRVDGRWQAATQLDDVEIPDTVQAVLAARIDLLDRAEKRALQMAAVVGREFWTGAVATLLPADPVEVDNLLGQLDDRQLVTTRLGSMIAGQCEYAFKHILTRDVAYDLLPRRDRWRTHAAVAGWIERVAAGREREHVDLLAHHYTEAYRGGREQRAPEPDLERLRRRGFELTLLASGESRTRCCAEKGERLAAAALELAVTPVERAKALEARGLACFVGGMSNNQAWGYWTEAIGIRQAEVPRDGSAIAHLCALAVEAVTRWSGTTRVWAEAEADVRRLIDLGLTNAPANSEELVRLLVCQAVMPAYFPHSDDEGIRRGHEAAVRATEVARSLHRPDLLSAALDGASSLEWVRGHFGQVQPLIDERLALLPVIHNEVEVADILNMASKNALHIGRYQDALAHARENVRRCNPEAVRGWALFAISWRGLANFWLGRWADLAEDVAASEALMTRDEREAPPYFASLHYAAAALVAEVQGDSDSSQDLILRLDRGDRLRGYPHTEKAPLLARALTRRGDVAAARARLDHPRFAVQREGEGFRLAALAEIVVTTGEWAAAGALATAIREFAAEAGLEALPAQADRLEGLAALAGGDPTLAAPLLGRAAAAFAAQGARWEAARTELALAGALAELGEQAPAQLALGRALPVLEELRSLAELATARELEARLAAA